jgi:hypothetical protein
MCKALPFLLKEKLIDIRPDLDDANLDRQMALAIFHDSILEKERARDATKRQEDEAKDQERAAMLTSAANKKAASAQKKEPG